MHRLYAFAGGMAVATIAMVLSLPANAYPTAGRAIADAVSKPWGQATSGASGFARIILAQMTTGFGFGGGGQQGGGQQGGGQQGGGQAGPSGDGAASWRNWNKRSSRPGRRASPGYSIVNCRNTATARICNTIGGPIPGWRCRVTGEFTFTCSTPRSKHPPITTLTTSPPREHTTQKPPRRYKITNDGRCCHRHVVRITRRINGKRVMAYRYGRWHCHVKARRYKHCVAATHRRLKHSWMR